MTQLDASQLDDLTRIFNSAVVELQAQPKRDFSAELFELVKTPAFSAVLSAVNELARAQGISEKSAAVLVFQTVEKLGLLWGEYLKQEGTRQLGLSN